MRCVFHAVVSAAVATMCVGCVAGQVGDPEKGSIVQSGVGAFHGPPTETKPGAGEPPAVGPGPNGTIAIDEDAGEPVTEPPDAASVDASVHDAGHPTMDAGGALDATVHDAGAAPPDAGMACTPARTPNGDGHPPDYDCMASGCHGPGSAVAGLLITVSGTLHSTANNGTPVGGATVYVTDSTGQTIALVTSANGIFWSGSSNGQSVPAGPQGTCASGTCTTYAAAGAMRDVTVSKCPDAPRSCPTPMSGQCANCHTPGTSGQQSVHLP